MTQKRNKATKQLVKAPVAEFLQVQPEETDETLKIMAGQQLTPVPPNPCVHLCGRLRLSVCLFVCRDMYASFQMHIESYRGRGCNA